LPTGGCQEERHGIGENFHNSGGQTGKAPGIREKNQKPGELPLRGGKGTSAPPNLIRRSGKRPNAADKKNETGLTQGQVVEITGPIEVW